MRRTVGEGNGRLTPRVTFDEVDSRAAGARARLRRRRRVRAGRRAAEDVRLPCCVRQRQHVCGSGPRQDVPSPRRPRQGKVPRAPRRDTLHRDGRPSDASVGGRSPRHGTVAPGSRGVARPGGATRALIAAQGAPAGRHAVVSQFEGRNADHVRPLEKTSSRDTTRASAVLPAPARGDSLPQIRMGAAQAPIRAGTRRRRTRRPDSGGRSMAQAAISFSHFGIRVTALARCFSQPTPSYRGA